MYYQEESSPEVKEAKETEKAPSAILFGSKVPSPTSSLYQPVKCIHFSITDLQEVLALDK